LIIQNAFHNFDQFVTSSQPKGFLPQTRPLVSNNENVEMILLVVYVLAKFVQCPIYVLFFASEKVPAGPGDKFVCILFQSGGRVDILDDND